METINARIGRVVEALGFNVLNDFDKEIEVKRNTTATYLGKRQPKPGPEFLEKMFIRFPEIDTRWMMTGQGSMFTPEKLKPAYVENLEARYEKRDSEAKIFEMAMNMGMKVSHNTNFQSVSELTPVKKIDFYEKIVKKAA